jgi:hypothetical protein
MADLTAGVFDMNSFTVTKSVANYFDDNLKVPINEGVGKGKIDSDGFLADIKAGFADDKKIGIDQTIIKGDKVTEIRGNQYEKVHTDRGTHIVGKEELKIDVMRNTEVEENDELTIHGNHYTDVDGDTERTNLGGLVETIIGPRKLNEVSTWVQWEGLQAMKIALDYMQVAAINVQMAGAAFEGYGAKLEAGGVLGELIGNKEKATVNNFEITVLRPTVQVLQMRQFVFSPFIGFFPHGTIIFHPAA